MIFDGQHLRDPVAKLDLGWRSSTQQELSLIADFYHLLTKTAGVSQPPWHGQSQLSQGGPRGYS